MKLSYTACLTITLAFFAISSVATPIEKIENGVIHKRGEPKFPPGPPSDFPKSKFPKFKPKKHGKHLKFPKGKGEPKGPKGGDFGGPKGFGPKDLGFGGPKGFGPKDLGFGDPKGFDGPKGPKGGDFPPKGPKGGDFPKDGPKG
ncbi:hypothetical protein C1645_880669, partial [Glomus cerebriforme]